MLSRRPLGAIGPRKAAAAAGYQGLGDAVASGWLHYWGFRAFTAALIGNNICELRRDSDNDTEIFTSQADGGLDLAAVATWSAAAGVANIFVRTLYDQVGSADLQHASATANQPRFVTSGLGGLPSMWAQVAAGTQFNSVTFATVDAQPVTVVAVVNHTSSSGSQLLYRNDNLASWFRNDSNNQYSIWGGAAAAEHVTAPDNAFNSLQGIHNGSASTVTVNGVTPTTTGAAIGTAGLTVNEFAMFMDGGGGQKFDGFVAELALNSTALTTPQLAAVYANHAYYGV